MSLLTQVITHLATFVRNLLRRTEENPVLEEKRPQSGNPEPSNTTPPQKPKGPVELYQEKWQRRRKPQK